MARRAGGEIWRAPAISFASSSASCNEAEFVGCREGDVQFLFAELEFVEKCTARTMIEHFASRAISSSQSCHSPMASFAPAQRLGFTIHFCTVCGLAAGRISGSTLQFFSRSGRPYSRIRRRRRSAWRKCASLPSAHKRNCIPCNRCFCCRGMVG
jgi:hypothetical protein